MAAAYANVSPANAPTSPLHAPSRALTVSNTTSMAVPCANAHVPQIYAHPATLTVPMVLPRMTRVARFANAHVHCVCVECDVPMGSKPMNMDVKCAVVMSHAG